eukprot:TRINITY_DN17140_c0_g5_i1.p1 TRINITY_DN17140_c0_g5~~TRINITY_DN17140_c0_g5_i1.p1  ORF type:complete len:202 (-),score=54.11 TRINITY_DN17140_c0_g5_i1:423-1028(-)
MSSLIMYPSGTSDPNQMQNKDFIPGKKANYYQVNSRLQYYTDQAETHNRWHTCDVKKSSLNQTVRPRSYWKLQKPAQSKSQQEDRRKLWELKGRTKRFNEQGAEQSSVLRYPKVKGAKRVKEEMVAEIVKGLEDMNEEGLAGMLSYMKFIQEEQAYNEAISNSNLKKPQINDFSLKREDLELKSHVSAKSRDTVSLKIPNM